MIPESINDLCFYECFDCGNSFYTFDLPGGINDPRFCPYCGVYFKEVVFIGDKDD